MNPRSLIKNIPSKSQQWKAPVKYWVRELYEKQQMKIAAEDFYAQLRADPGIEHVDAVNDRHRPHVGDAGQ